MPRWYALCRGNALPACIVCRRHTSNNGNAAEQPQQGFTTPELVGTHCNKFMELPPAVRSGAVTPTDSR